MINRWYFRNSYLLQCVGATGQLLLVLRMMAGALAWPTTGAEVRPWFLFPQRWPPPPPGPLPVPPGIPGWGPLSLHALLENISRFLSSHFIIFPPFTVQLFLLPFSISFTVPFSREEFSREKRFRNAWKMDTPVGFKLDSGKKVFFVNGSSRRDTLSSATFAPCR